MCSIGPMKWFFLIAVIFNTLGFVNMYDVDAHQKEDFKSDGMHMYGTKMEREVARHGEGARAYGLMLDLAASIGYSLWIHLAAIVAILVRLFQKRWADALKWASVIPSTILVMFAVYWAMYGVFF